MTYSLSLIDVRTFWCCCCCSEPPKTCEDTNGVGDNGEAKVAVDCSGEAANKALQKTTKALAK